MCAGEGKVYRVNLDINLKHPIKLTEKGFNIGNWSDEANIHSAKVRCTACGYEGDLVNFSFDKVNLETPVIVAIDQQPAQEYVNLDAARNALRGLSVQFSGSKPPSQF
jgi:hypothetical protein